MTHWNIIKTTTTNYQYWLIANFVWLANFGKVIPSNLGLVSGVPTI